MHKKLLDETAISRALKRISFEIREHNPTQEPLALVGIYTRGADIATRVHQLILTDRPGVKLGYLDITPKRDDGRRSNLNQTKLPFTLTGTHVVLVDDVFYTGRSVRAALDLLMEHGRPASIQVAVLVDRGHRELPLRADYVGKNLPTTKGERIKVHLTPRDGEDAVYLLQSGERLNELAY